MKRLRVFRWAATASAAGVCALLLWGCEKEQAAPGEEAATEEGAHSHGEGAAHGPHDGALGALAGGHGFVELKLHDDKGDLELWLARDAAISEPIDLPLDAQPVVTFLDKDSKTATLAVRNREHNEDENGTPNIRDGRTHYFVFPGDSGEDAQWLEGKDFESRVVVRFEHEGQTLESEPFVLAPHGHVH